jgi:very-short-patch-repair endonuclease
MIDLIKKIDIYKYFGKGGVMKFKKDFGIEIFNEINNLTKVLDEGPFSNRKFTARLVFIKKYDINYNSIIINNKLKIFNGFDFIETSKNSAIKQWSNTKKILSEQNFYDKEETINLLKNNYISYFGKSGNRKLIKDNPKLYNSIYYHTEFLNLENKNNNKLPHRILFLINNISDVKCNNCLKKKTWKILENNLEIYCYKCKPKFPQKSWFIEKYGENGEFQYEKYFNYIKDIKSNSLEWYIEKYGHEGNNLYYNRYQEQNLKMNSLKSKRYSMISQDLFNSIKNRLSDHTNLYYKTFNNEFYIKLPKDNILKQTIIFLDFKYKNKIIEYNGDYWHDDEKDERRKKLLEDMGYEYLSISSSEYNRNKKDEYIIEKCIKFLNNGKK